MRFGSTLLGGMAQYPVLAGKVPSPGRPSTQFWPALYKALPGACTQLWTAEVPVLGCSGSSSGGISSQFARAQYPVKAGIVLRSIRHSPQFQRVQYSVLTGLLPSSDGTSTKFWQDQCPVRVGPVPSSCGPNTPYRWAQHPVLTSSVRSFNVLKTKVSQDAYSTLVALKPSSGGFSTCFGVPKTQFWSAQYQVASFGGPSPLFGWAQYPVLAGFVPRYSGPTTQLWRALYPVQAGHP